VFYLFFAPHTGKKDTSREKVTNCRILPKVEILLVKKSDLKKEHSCKNNIFAFINALKYA